MVGVVLPGVVAIQGDGLVEKEAGAAIRLGRIDPMEVHVRLGLRDEKGAGQMQDMQPLELDVTAIIHHVDLP